MKVKYNMPWFDGIQGMPSPNLKYLTQCHCTNPDSCNKSSFETWANHCLPRVTLCFPIVYPKLFAFLLSSVTWHGTIPIPSHFFPVSASHTCFKGIFPYNLSCEVYWHRTDHVVLQQLCCQKDLSHISPSSRPFNLLLLLKPGLIFFPFFVIFSMKLHDIS